MMKIETGFDLLVEVGAQILDASDRLPLRASSTTSTQSSNQRSVPALHNRRVLETPGSSAATRIANVNESTRASDNDILQHVYEVAPVVELLGRLRIVETDENLRETVSILELSLINRGELILGEEDTIEDTLIPDSSITEENLEYFTTANTHRVVFSGIVDISPEANYLAVGRGFTIETRCPSTATCRYQRIRGNGAICVAGGVTELKGSVLINELNMKGGTLKVLHVVRVEDIAILEAGTIYGRFRSLKWCILFACFLKLPIFCREHVLPLFPAY